MRKYIVIKNIAVCIIGINASSMLARIANVSENMGFIIVSLSIGWMLYLISKTEIDLDKIKKPD